MKYDVFVSYRHVRPDADVARAVARLVEGYVVAGSVGGVVKRRGFRVFRDVEELASGELGVLIESALAESEFLVVVCSPRTVGSVWCMREVEFFSRVRGVDHVLAVVVEGDPGVVVGDVVGGDVLAVDVRAGVVRSEGFGGFEGCESGVVDRLVRQSVGVLRRDGIDRLMAGVVGVSLGDLRQRQRERRMRRIIAATASATLVTGLFAVTSAGLWLKARHDTDLAKQRNTEVLMDLADTTIAGGDRELGLLYSELAWSKADPEWDSYSQLRGKHYANMASATRSGPLAPLTKLKTNSGVASFGIGSNGSIVTAGKGASLSIWDSANGKRLRSITLYEKPIDVGASEDGTRFYGLDRQGRLTVTPSAGGPARTVRIANARAVLGTVLVGDRFFVVHDPMKGSAHIRGYNVTTGAKLFDADLAGRIPVGFDNAPNGSEFALAFKGGGAARYDGGTGKLRQMIVDPEQDAAALSASRLQNGAVDYSASGNKLVYFSAAAMYAVSLPSGETTAKPIDNHYLTGGVRLSRDGSFLIDPALQKKIDVATGQERASYTGMRRNLQDNSDSSWLSPKDDVYIVGTADRELRMWDNLSDSKFFGDLSYPSAIRPYSGSPVTRGQFTRDGKRFVAATSDGNLTIYDVEASDGEIHGDGKIVTRSNNREHFQTYERGFGRTFDVRKKKSTEAVNAWPAQRTALSNDGKVIAMNSKKNPDVITVVVDPDTEEYHTPEKILKTDGTTVVFGPSHDVVYATEKGEVVHYDSTGKLRSYGSTKEGEIVSLLASADGSVLVVNREGEKWRAYNVKTGKLLKRGEGTVHAISGKGGAFESATAVSGNSIRNVEASGKIRREVKIPKEILREVKSGKVFDATENRLLVGTQKQVVIVDLALGEIVQRLQTPVANARALFVSGGIAYDVREEEGGKRFALIEDADLFTIEVAANAMLGDRQLTEAEEEVIGR